MDYKSYDPEFAPIKTLIKTPSAEQFFCTGNLGETSTNNFFTALKCNIFCLEVKMAEEELGESEEDEAWKQQHYIYFKKQYSFIILVL